MLLEDTLDVVGTVKNGGYKKKKCRNISVDRSKDISDEEFTRLFTEEIPDGSWSGEIRMNDAVCQLYYGKVFWKAVLWCTENPAEDQRMARVNQT